jgi:hypothetical protein
MKMEKRWVNFVQNFNESSQYSVKFFSVLNFQFLRHFISVCLIYEQNLWLHMNIAVTWLKADNFECRLTKSTEIYNFM